VRLALWLVACASCGRIGFGVGSGDGGSGDGVIIGDGQGAANIVFATNMAYATSLGGLAGADTICANTATSAGLTGHYVAWLSTSTVNAASRLVVPGTSTPARGWVRRDGKPVADRISDLALGTMYYPIRLDEGGTDLAPGAHDVLTGTDSTGQLVTGYDQCLDWTVTGTAHTFAEGDLPSTTQQWTQFSSNDCTLSGHLYCFGVDATIPVPAPPPPAGRLAFVSNGTWTPSGGIGAADTLCANEAQARSFSGTFRAFLATTSATAASRFDPAPGPWYRLDGVPLAATGAQSLAFAPLDVPLTIDSTGNRVVVHVWTGAATPTTMPGLADNCSDWLSNAVAQTGYTGDSTSSTSAFGEGNDACNVANAIYCFQQ
jgi:hypothetical protein